MSRQIGLGIAAFLVVVLMAGVFAAPIGPVPGFILGGTSRDTPFDFEALKDRQEITIRVQDEGLPRVVIIWFATHNGQTYVSGSSESGWVTRLEASGELSLRVDNETYDYEVEVMRDSFAEILAAFVDKYRADYPDIVAGYPPAEEMAQAMRAFRLKSS